MKPTVRIQTVTPKMAEKWLASNTRNRRLREHRVVQMAKLLQDGEWRLTNDAVVFDENGILTNGQHRLAAIVASEVPADIIVLRGTPAETQNVMDRGLKRSLGDALKLQGEVDVHSLGSALMWTWRLGYIERTGVIHPGPDEGPSVPYLLGILAEHPDLRECLKLADRPRLSLKIRKGLAGALYYAFDKIDRKDNDLFWYRLGTGLDITATDPIYALRRVLLKDAISPRKMADYRQAALIIKAWNLWREGREVRTITWHYGGSSREAFPLPI